MNKVNTFPGVTAPSLLIILSNLFTAFEAAFEPILLTNQSKLSLAKAIARSVTIFFYLNHQIKNQEIHLIQLF